MRRIVKYLRFNLTLGAQTPRRQCLRNRVYLSPRPPLPSPPPHRVRFRIKVEAASRENGTLPRCLAVERITSRTRRNRRLSKIVINSSSSVCIFDHSSAVGSSVSVGHIMPSMIEKTFPPSNVSRNYPDDRARFRCRAQSQRRALSLDIDDHALL